MIRARKFLWPAACFTLLASAAFADVWNKKTKLTFSGPVEIPGASLDAGTYVFKLMDSQSNRHIVQVTNEAENKTHAIILAIPDYRLNPTSKTVVYFSERPAGQAPAIKSWFYPGDNTGQRFVYPKEKAQQIAMTTSQPVPSYELQTREPLTVESSKTVEKFSVEQPDKKTTEYDAKEFEKFDAADSAGIEGEVIKQEEKTISQQPATPAPAPVEPERTTPAQTPADDRNARMAAQTPPAATELPATASPVHLMTALGGLMLGASLLARRMSR